MDLPSKWNAGGARYARAAPTFPYCVSPVPETGALRSTCSKRNVVVGAGRHEVTNVGGWSRNEFALGDRVAAVLMAVQHLALDQSVHVVPNCVYARLDAVV